MLDIDRNLTVSELARSLPGAFRVFERHRIDYCCGGRRPLTEACQVAHVSVDALVLELATESLGAATPEPPAGVGALIDHILETHHTFEAAELTRLAPLAEKVVRVHGSARPELPRVGQLLRELAQDLIPHMCKEERVLFPAMRALEAGEPMNSCFGSIDNPLRVMLAEHDRVAELLRELERVSMRYTPPANACGTYQALYQGLAELQADVHRHMYLENELLFPRARALTNAAESPG